MPAAGTSVSASVGGGRPPSDRGPRTLRKPSRPRQSGRRGLVSISAAKKGYCRSHPAGVGNPLRGEHLRDLLLGQQFLLTNQLYDRLAGLERFLGDLRRLEIADVR